MVVHHWHWCTSTADPELRATGALCLLIGEVAWLAGLAISHRLAGPSPVASLWLVPPVVAGMALSSLVHHRVGARGLRTGVLLFAMASGLLLLPTPQ